MVSLEKQQEFSTLVTTKFTDKERAWINTKTTTVASIETSHKFSVFFSLVTRFFTNETSIWNISEIETIEQIYPGFSKSTWSKQDLARILLMIALDKSINESILRSFFEVAEMKEQVALYKGLFFLENAKVFSTQVAEGIRTNMANVFDAIASGNPFAYTYLNEDAWNQLILKSFFMDRTLYTVQYIDEGKNEKLAHMLQDYVLERWAANRQISPEIWRMINGYLREDIKAILLKRDFKNIEKEAIDAVLNKSKNTDSDFWNTIGKKNN